MDHKYIDDADLAVVMLVNRHELSDMQLHGRWLCTCTACDWARFELEKVKAMGAHA